MRIGPHSHPCSVCGTKTECCGDIEQNYDGIPEWICREYHGDNRDQFICETCDGDTEEEDTEDDVDQEC